MKDVIFSEKDWGYIECPTCGEKITLPFCGNKAYETRFLTCRSCKKVFNYYANPIGKIFNEKDGKISYLGSIYKVL